MDTGDEHGIEIQGTVERVLYRAVSDGYTVAVVRDLDDRVWKVVGSLLPQDPPVLLRIRGAVEIHPKYGSQLRILEAVPALPTSRAGVERYLSSGAVKGIGPVLARRLVDHFGDQVLEVVDRSPRRLLEVEGVGEVRLTQILDSWSRQTARRDTAVFLHGLGLGPSLVSRIHRVYGDDAAARVRENPYRLIQDVGGVGFRTADRIARELGIEEDSPDRLAAACGHALSEAAQSEGHTCLPHEVMARRVERLLSCDRQKAATALDQALATGLLVAEPTAEGGPLIYLHSLHWTESSAAEILLNLASARRKGGPIEAESALAWAESLLEIRLSPGQKGAIEAALNEKIAVITGGPGVGKTTVIRSICTILEANNRRIALAAPTGRAAKRLQEATGRSARTLHRLLRFDPESGGFSHDPDNPLPYDTVIVDESSMIDLALFHALLSGLDPGTSLVLTGDVDQLPSVGPGRVLDDLIRSGRIRVVRLEEIFRQKRESRIVINAHRIHRGLLPESATGAALSDFYFIEREHPLEARRLLVRLVKEEIPRKFGLDPRTEIQVLTPMHKGICGGVALNACLKLALNPRQETLLPDDDGERDPGDAPPELEDVAWNETEETFLPHNAFFDPGDRVMQIRNDYEKEVFNGDVGTVVAAADGGGIVIDFDGRHVAYAPDERDQLLPAYAITVHKAQGSEYPCVVLPLTLEHRVMLQRNLLYTGVTRAKSLVILVGSKEALRIAVENRRDHGRFSGLRGRLSASPAHSPSRESPSSS